MGPFEVIMAKISDASLFFLYFSDTFRRILYPPYLDPRISRQFAQSARETIAAVSSIGFDTCLVWFRSAASTFSPRLRPWVMEGASTLSLILAMSAHPFLYLGSFLRI
jgi:hypothetical protein